MGRPSGSVAPVGNTLALTTSGRFRPMEFTYPTATDTSFPIARSTCTLLSHAYCVAKSALAVRMLFGGKTPAGRPLSVPGNAGAFGCNGEELTGSRRGLP